MSAAGSPMITSPRDMPDDGLPVKLEQVPGEWPRLVFRRCPGHRHDELWQQRSVRTPPSVAGQRAGRLAYYNNSKTMGNSNVLQVILRDHGYERVEAKEEDWSVFWCAGQIEASDLCTFLPHQKVNKFPRASALTLKSNLWSCFARMLAKHGAAHFDFMPHTFVLPGQMTLYADYMKARQTERGGDKDVWILKPAAAYCGRGIFLHRPGDQNDADDVLTESILEHRGVACRYIDPPFLLDGLKSDIRLYVLVTSFHPLTLYLYEDGLARFATEPYDMSNIDARCMHLTNYSLNKHSKNFVKNTNEEDDNTGSKWSLSAFKRKLIEVLGEAKAARVWEQVDDLVVKTLLAAEPTIFESMRANVPAAQRGEPNRMCFQLFGFDVMLDSNAKPWLLEVNLDPALRTESPLDLKIKSSMLVDLLNVVGLPLPPAPETPMPAAAAGGVDAAGLADVSDGDSVVAVKSEAGVAVKTEASAAVAAADSATGAADISDPGAAAAAEWNKRRREQDRAWGAARQDSSASDIDQTAAAAAAAAAKSPRDEKTAELSDVELWHLALTNAEYERSKATKWRRLLPGPRSSEYIPFIDASRTHNKLPFTV